MITKRTVIVFGAGASVPFGLPSGFALFQRMSQFVDSDNNAVLRKFDSIGTPPNESRDFVQALRASGKTSVDAFLEHRPDLLGIGKLAIAIGLVPCEHESFFFARPNGPHLYDHLYARLNAPPERFDQNRLTVITYNYDRSFEHYLTTSLTNSYKLSLADAASLARSVPVLHLHGQLGTYPPFGPGGRHYDAVDDAANLQIAASGIKIIHEANPQDDVFKLARFALGEAESIHVLGFGWDPTNMTRLFASADIRIGAVFGSTMGLTNAQKRAVEERFGRAIVLDTQNRDALGYLTDCPALDR